MEEGLSVEQSSEATRVVFFVVLLELRNLTIYTNVVNLQLFELFCTNDLTLKKNDLTPIEIS